VSGDRPLVTRRAEGGVVTLGLDRGDRFNPLSGAMIAALEAELTAAAADPSARVLVLAGAGRGFCAGHDLRELREHAGDLEWQRQLFAACGRLMALLPALPIPVIARVHGIATAAGCQLVSMCDLAVASEEARFALPGVGIGLFCSTPAVGVARNVGRKRAMQLLLTGEPIDAATALAWGLVNRVVPAAGLDAEVARLAGSIAARSRTVIEAGKRAFYQQVELPLAEAHALAGEEMACGMMTEDAAEGIEAFLGKREPMWRGR
jgi:enoyl-CoA hydratase/carnithine racemase